MLQCGVDAQGFQGEFLWQGTSDVSAWLAVPAALRVMRAVGLDTWRNHNTSLLHDAVSLLSRAFDTDPVAGARPTWSQSGLSSALCVSTLV